MLSSDDEATREKYRTVWSQFGRVLKEGLLSDFDNRDTLLEISSFPSTHSEDEQTTLAQYVERMKDGQEQIYYLTGESRQQLEASPHMEAFRARGLEVLLLTDPVDEMWVTSVPEFDGKPLQSIAKGEVDSTPRRRRRTPRPSVRNRTSSSPTFSPGSPPPWRSRSSRCACRRASPTPPPASSATSSA